MENCSTLWYVYLCDALMCNCSVTQGKDGYGLVIDLYGLVIDLLWMCGCVFVLVGRGNTQWAVDHILRRYYQAYLAKLMRNEM